MLPAQAVEQIHASSFMKNHIPIVVQPTRKRSETGGEPLVPLLSEIVNNDRPPLIQWQPTNQKRTIRRPVPGDKTRRRLTQGMRDLGFATVESQANFVWNPHASLSVKPLYEKLKDNRVLVRYMDYSGWGDGLRISVGTDDQIDACLALLKSMI